MEQYAIGIIIQEKDSLAKLKSVFDKARTLVDNKSISAKEAKFLVKGVEGEIKFFIGIAKNVSSQVRLKLGSMADYDNAEFIPNIICIEFGEDYTYDQMKQKLIQFIGEQWMGYYWIIDIDSTLIGNLLTNFKRY